MYVCETRLPKNGLDRLTRPHGLARARDYQRVTCSVGKLNKEELGDRTCHVSGRGVRGQLLELGLVKGRKVPAARVFCQSVVTPGNVDSCHVKIVESREEPDLSQAKLYAQCS